MAALTYENEHFTNRCYQITERVRVCSLSKGNRVVEKKNWIWENPEKTNQQSNYVVTVQPNSSIGRTESEFEFENRQKDEKGARPDREPNIR